MSCRVIGISNIITANTIKKALISFDLPVHSTPDYAVFVCCKPRVKCSDISICRIKDSVFLHLIGALEFLQVLHTLL